jgi:hypothetical protein
MSPKRRILGVALGIASIPVAYLAGYVLMLMCWIAIPSPGLIYPFHVYLVALLLIVGTLASTWFVRVSHPKGSLSRQVVWFAVTAMILGILASARVGIGLLNFDDFG